MALNFQEFGEGEPLIILHGLFGSGRNWQGIAKQLAERFHVYTVDLRNHGSSPHLESMSYSDMAADLVDFMDQQGLAAAHILAHSMGGKVAMRLALTQAERLLKLMVIDIAPVAYQHGFNDVLAGLKSVPVAEITSRKQADEILSQHIEVVSLRQFLLQSLVPSNSGGYEWRINVSSIENNLTGIIGFELTEAEEYLGETLFISGGNSTYLSKDKQKIALKYFPSAAIEVIPKVGHWPHVESPAKFLELINSFL